MQDRGFGIPVVVHVFLTVVDALADDFPEQGSRERQWVDPARAATMVAEPELAAILRGLGRPAAAR